jgi:outer membrane protein TolC
MLEMGRMDVPTFQSLTDAMYRAQADLRTTAAERVELYEKLVEALATQEKLLERQAESGRTTEVQVAQGKLVTLNARIDLERLRLGEAPARP